MSAYSNRVISDGALYFWRLGESSGLTAVASVGGANGTISGGVTLGQAGAIADGSTAMLFNGTTGQILLPAIPWSAAFTIEAWIKATNPPDFVPIFSNRNATPAHSQILLGVISGTLLVYSDNASPGVSNSGAIVIGDGVWHHVAVTSVGSALKMYVDGQLDASLTTTFVVPTTDVAGIGYENIAPFRRWPGFLDDVAIYPRALTAAEVSAHYASGRTTEVGAQGPYADRVISDGASNYWRLNESSGTVARDIVSAKDGTISGGVTLGQPSPLQDGTSAMLFNGTTGKIVTAAGFTLPQVVTIEMWMKATDATIQRPALATSDWFSTGIYIGIAAGGALTLYSPSIGQPTGGVVTDGLWHHAVFVVTATTAAIYRDGILVASAAAGRSAPNTAILQIGNSGGAEYWNGSLDEVAIYPRAMSASEIAAHYAVSSVPEPRDLNTGLYTYLLGIFGLSAATSYADRVRADGATNHWRLGETAGTVAVDAIGGANGTISGGVTLNQPSALADGNPAMLFNGTTGKIVTAANVPLVTPFTLEWWIRTTDTTQRTFLSNYSGLVDGQWYFDLYLSKLHVHYVYAGGQQNDFLAQGPVLTDGQWHHVVVVFTATTMQAYVDTVNIPAWGALPGAMAGSTRPLELGASAYTAQFFTGSLDDVSIYPRALTATEIAAHSSLGRSGLSGGNDLTTLITRYLATLSGDMTARWKQMEKNAGF